MKLRSLALMLLLATSAWADPTTDKALSIARHEWEFFGRQTIHEGKITHSAHRETDEGYWQRVGVYWKTGVDENLTGKDTDQPWSAAFISYVMREAGMGDRFLYSDWHAHYINRAIEAREKNDQHYGFWGYRLSERAPMVGDLVCYARKEGIDFDHRTDTYPSHSDLVVAVREGEIDVIGGNVEDSVTMKTLDTDANGHLIDHHNQWFAVLRNRLANPQGG
jgi:hypothetical protein